MEIEIEEIQVPDTERMGAFALTDIAPRPGNRQIGGLDKDSLKELAQSMKADGLHQPIIVRPGRGKKRYEVVAGERRYRAAKLLKWKKIAGIVRQYDDQAAQRASIIENVQREGIHPLDEAAAYRKLMQTAPNVAEVAAMVGRSPGYVRGRMKLYDLCEEGRKRLNESKLTAGAAVKLARLPEKAQLKILNQHGAYGITDAETMAGWTRYGGVMTDLKVPFKLNDPELVPKAGACTECSKRTGTDPTLFEDEPENTCLDRVCLRKKMNAWAASLAGGKEFDIKIMGRDKALSFDLPISTSPSWELARCKKTDEGAKRVLIITGKDAGKVRWMKKEQHLEHDYQGDQRKREVLYLAYEMLTEKLLAGLYEGNSGFLAFAAFAANDEPVRAACLGVGNELSALEFYRALTTIRVTHEQIALGVARDGFREMVNQSRWNEPCQVVLKEVGKLVKIDPEAELERLIEEAGKQYDQEAGRVCRVCGCTDASPCVNPKTGQTCSWVELDLCSSCVAKATDDE